MTTKEVTQEKSERLKALTGFKILDMPPKKRYDNITKLASEIYETSFSANHPTR
ncbi:MAG: hypothetical protein ACI83W_002701 [Marinoscillum sp.]|jgi:hypothetical protein